jgi:hypothetical protein
MDWLKRLTDSHLKAKKTTQKRPKKELVFINYYTKEFAETAP